MIKESISDEQLRNTRAWAATRVGQLSGAEVIVAACDEALAARAKLASRMLSTLLAELDRVWDRLGEEMASTRKENPTAIRVRSAMQAAGIQEIKDYEEKLVNIRADKYIADMLVTRLKPIVEALQSTQQQQVAHCKTCNCNDECIEHSPMTIPASPGYAGPTTFCRTCGEWLDGDALQNKATPPTLGDAQ